MRNKVLWMVFLISTLLQPPATGTEINMPIGDVLKKVALGTPVSQGEADELRLWANQMEIQAAYISGLQTGQSDIDARDINAIESNTDILQGKMVVLYATAVDGSYLDFDSGFTEVPDQGYFTYDSADSTKLTLTTQTRNKLTNSLNSGYKFFLAGYFAFSPGSVTSLNMEFYDSADALLDTQTLIASSTRIVTYYHYAFPTVDTDLSTCAYIKFKLTLASGSIGANEIYIWLVR